MRIIGLDAIQTEIVRSTTVGESYADIADRLGLDRYYVIKQEMLALAILRKQWRKDEIDIKQQLKSMFLLILCLFLSFYTFEQNLTGEHFEIDITRTRTGRTRTRARQDGDSGDDLGDIVLRPARTRTRNGRRGKKQEAIC